MNRTSSIVLTGLAIAALVHLFFGALACQPAAEEASGRSERAPGGAGECVPSRNPEPVADACGVFVRLAGDDAHEGTKSRPVATLARAIELAAGSGRPVYACAEVFQEAVGLPDGITIYGGLRCEEGWLFGGSFHRTILAGEPRKEEPSERSPSSPVSPGVSNVKQLLAMAAHSGSRVSIPSGPSVESQEPRDLAHLPESILPGVGAEAPSPMQEAKDTADLANGSASVPDSGDSPAPVDDDTSSPWSGLMND